MRRSCAAFWLLLVVCMSTTWPVVAVAAGSGNGQSDMTARFVEQGTGQLRSPFAAQRVHELNWIVRRSLAVIESYDADIPAMRHDLDIATGQDPSRRAHRKAIEALGKLADLSKRAARAARDMRLSVADLESSDEYYNDVILAGMLSFVTKVDVEIRHAHEVQSSRLADAAG